MELADAISEGIVYGEFLHQRRSTQSKIATLDRLGAANLTHPDTDHILFARVIDDIVAGKPFSVVRLGDGEGNVLFWGSRRAEYPALARVGMDGIWSLMFGGSAASDSSFDLLYELIAAAALNADYLGIPFAVQDEHSIDLMRNPGRDTVGIRGTMGQAAVWDWVATHTLESIESGRTTLVNAYFHSSLPGYLQPILASAGRVSLITCHERLMDRLVHRFGTQSGFNYLIPTQFSNTGTTPDGVHFPDRFLQIDRELSRYDLRGELFLVGAGLPGKAYCERVRRQGGMAIDVGSMMDVWMGLSVRQYHDAAFMAECQLGPADAQ